MYAYIKPLADSVHCNLACLGEIYVFLVGKPKNIVLLFIYMWLDVLASMFDREFCSLVMSLQKSCMLDVMHFIFRVEFDASGVKFLISASFFVV